MQGVHWGFRARGGWGPWVPQHQTFREVSGWPKGHHWLFISPITLLSICRGSWESSDIFRDRLRNKNEWYKLLHWEYLPSVVETERRGQAQSREARQGQKSPGPLLLGPQGGQAEGSMYWEAAGVVGGSQAERGCAVGAQPRTGTRRRPQRGPEAAGNWLLPAERSLGLQGRLSPEVGVSL